MCINYNMYSSSQYTRIRLTLHGIVQGVGFRPFVYRCAKERGLTGFVENTPEGVIVEIQGNIKNLKDFVDYLLANQPPSAHISDIEKYEIDVANDTDFLIKESSNSVVREPVFPPDFSLCDDCLRELFDPSNRRYRYPFINCTICGPRFTIIKGLPYDRSRTAMGLFKMCPDCMAEYTNPLNRRFHAEAIACSECGPKVFWVDAKGRVSAEGEAALRICEDTIKRGSIAAVKGIGGFHLMTDASNDEAVKLLRNRKARYEKPFAVLFTLGRDGMLSSIKAEAMVNEYEEKTILSRERPIVILKRRGESRLSKLASPRFDTVGAFLPYSPLHYLLTDDLKMPLIATSANFSDSPIIKDNQEAIEKLKRIADGFLLHDRDIVRRCDDSVVCVYGKKTVFFRRSRGYTPYIFKLPHKLNAPILAVGGNQKVTIALGWEDKAVVSQHLGDISTEEGRQAFEDAIRDLTDFYHVKPQKIAFDLHPDYISTKWALSQTGVAHIPVQHHHAHIASCMLDNNLSDRVLGVSWDGTGYGPDGTIWGGEFLVADFKNFRRFCTFRRFRLLGGEEAVREPRRVLLSMLYEIYGDEILKSQRVVGLESQRDMGSERIANRKHIPASIKQGLQIANLKDIFTETELMLFLQMLKKDFNSPFTTSAGRVFDAVSSLLGICHKANYEGQAAMMLENCAEKVSGNAYPVDISKEKDIYIFNWAPVLENIIADMRNNIDIKIISHNFHVTLSQLILQVAKIAKKEEGLDTVCLSGGVFQNKVLTEMAVSLLNDNGFHVYTHRILPPNDGGLSLGQLIVGGMSS